MRTVMDVVLAALLIVLIHSIYVLGDKILQSRPVPQEGASSTGYYRCGKTKRGDVYCPITVKGD
jgi:hypothetical protein